MNSYKAFQLYTCLRLHFISKKYDYFKYNGKTGAASVQNYEKRRDKFLFEKLAKVLDPRGYILANMIVNPNVFIRDLVLEKKYSEIYINWAKRNEALTYHFKNDLGALLEDFDANFKVEPNRYPHLLNLYLQRKVSIETFVILQNITDCASIWNKGHLQTDPIWEEVYSLSSKYSPFIKWDQKKFTDIVLERF